MRSKLATLLVAVSLFASVASLTSSEVGAIGTAGCCICAPCIENATVWGRGPGLDSLLCVPGAAEGECSALCDAQGCGFETFENATCNDPSLALTCGDPFVMAPAASTLGLIGLIAVLSCFGAFYLRRRAA